MPALEDIWMIPRLSTPSILNPDCPLSWRCCPMHCSIHTLSPPTKSQQHFFSPRVGTYYDFRHWQMLLSGWRDRKNHFHPPAQNRDFTQLRSGYFDSLCGEYWFCPPNEITHLAYDNEELILSCKFLRITVTLGNTSKTRIPHHLRETAIYIRLFSSRHVQVSTQVNISSVSCLNKDDLVSSHTLKLIQ